MKKCVFSGTFDPPTSGHRAVVESCLKIFDEVVVAIMVNTSKTPLLTVQQRRALIEKLFEGNPAVRVIISDGAAVDVLRQENTVFYVRGVRDGTDLAYENRDFFANKKLMEDIVTIYIPADQDKIQVSSTLVKNSVKFAKDYFDYVPREIEEDFRKMLEEKNV